MSGEGRNKKPAGDLGLGACVYPPQETKSSLPEYAADSRPNPPVAAQGGTVASRPVLPFDFHADWPALLEAARPGGAARAGRPGEAGEGGEGGEASRLEALLQALAEEGPDILPFLRHLREKAETDGRLAALADFLRDHLAVGADAAGALAPREMEVLELAADGASNPQIAKNLNLQTITVAKALSRAYRKLGAKNRADAVHKWMLLRDGRP